MLFHTVGQSRIFLTMLYAGMGVGLYGALDSAARRLFGAGRILSLFMDLLFGAVAAAIVISALLRASDGELRLYSLMGVLCGYLIFAGTLQPLLVRAARCASRWADGFMKRLGRSAFLKKIFR